MKPTKPNLLSKKTDQNIRNWILGLSLVVVLAALCLLFALGNFNLPTQAELQSYIQNWGIWGYLFYLCFGVTAVVIVPINFSLTGMAAAYIFGFTTALFSNWGIKIVGNFIAFLIGRYFGEKVFKLIKPSTRERYKRIAHSEEAVIAYFVLSFIPFAPSDFLPYFLGSSQMKKRVFLLVAFFGNLGTAFSLTYIGSGRALDNPLVFAGLIVFIIGGLAWLHMNRKRLGLS